MGGIGYDQIKSENPNLIYCSIYKLRDAVAQCRAGVCAGNPSSKGKPALVRQFYADKVTGLQASFAISAALAARNRGVGGQHVEISTLDVMMHWGSIDTFWNNHWIDPKAPPKFVPINELYCLFGCKEGPNLVQFFAASDVDFAALAKALGHPEWAKEEKWLTPAKRAGDWANLMKHFEDAAKQQPKEALLASLNKNECAHAKVLKLNEVATDPQVKHAGLIQRRPHKTYGDYCFAIPPVRFGGTPLKPMRQDAPTLGEHDAQILS